MMRWPAPGTAADPLRRTRQVWSALTAYERFEQVVSLIIGLLVSALIVLALVHLAVKILRLLLLDLADPSQQEVFQAVFGMVMTVLIALEFNHSILRVLERQHGVVRVRTVILIALLALIRKFIVIDAAHVDPLTTISLAGTVVALGAVYWLVRDQDRREPASEDVP
jgi:uncharacterized membrane protein (DUF373 family)